MADLQLDLEQLRQLWEDMSRTARQFGEVNGIGKELPDAVGHGGLNSKLHSFGSSWDEHRKKLIVNLDLLWKGIQVVQETFAEVEMMLYEQADAVGAANGTPEVLP